MRYNSLRFGAGRNYCSLGVAQSQTPATIDIDTANVVIYRHDISDATKVATEAGTTTQLPLRRFIGTWIGDVIAVNGTPARGTLTVRGTF